MAGYDLNSTALLLSIGTGRIPITRFERGWVRKYLGYINAARKLASDAESTHENLTSETMFGRLPYYRFNVPEGTGLDKIKLDEWKTSKSGTRKDTLETIRTATEAYCKEPSVRARLKEVAQILVDNRQRREKSAFWPLFSKGAQYRCTVQGCRESQQLKPRIEDLESHLREKHHLVGKELEDLLKQGVCPPREKRIEIT